RDVAIGHRTFRPVGSALPSAEGPSKVGDMSSSMNKSGPRRLPTPSGSPTASTVGQPLQPTDRWTYRLEHCDFDGRKQRLPGISLGPVDDDSKGTHQTQEHTRSTYMGIGDQRRNGRRPDATDQTILGALAKDARTGITEIAALANVSRATAYNRIKR